MTTLPRFWTDCIGCQCDSGSCIRWRCQHTNHWTLVSQNTCQFCLVTIHRHVNSDHLTTNCCPSQQTTQCSPAVRSAQLHLVLGTVYQLRFEQHLLPTLFDDTSRLIFSLATPPSTNCYHSRLRFELLFWHMARYKCRLLTYLLHI